ncbi:MAG: class I SAM-dependent methyltransferase [Candidatus Vogelbacteria bacterium]|nr:class I SAM-dependent methyltransferase [Candidatus Vogelbacteria bacterium]
MITRFSIDLKEQKIYANGHELASVMGLDKDGNGNRIYDYPDGRELFVATIKNPVLVTDIFKIGKFKPTVRDTLVKLLESSVKVTEYNGVKLSFEQGRYKGVWGPNIDTLLFCRALNKLDPELFNGKSVIEIGPGSGFISKYILERFSGINVITLVDLNPNAIQSSKDNIKDQRAKFVCGDAIKYIQGKKFDVLVCNPPYIPRQGSIDDNPYEGTGLINYLIAHSKEILNPGGVIITNLSSLSSKDVQRAVKDVGAREIKLDQMTVPLKVCNVLNNKEWMRYLLKCGLKKKYKNGYEYYQTISISEIIPWF